MTNRAQLKHLLLDVDFFNKPKVIAFRRKFKWVSLTWLLQCYCQMSRSSTGFVTRDTLLGLADDMGLEQSDEMIDYLVTNGLMFEIDGSLSNSRVIKDQESLALRRENDKQRQQSYREKNKVNHESVTCDKVRDKQGDKPVTPDTVTEYIDINNNNKIEKENIPDSDEDETPIQKMVKLALDEPNDQPWTRTNAYMLSGRRPMKKYPNIFLTPYEMEMVFNKYEPYTPEFRIMCFTQCEEKLRQKVENGERLMSLPAFTWLTTFIYQSALESLTKETRLKNQQSYTKIHP